MISVRSVTAQDLNFIYNSWLKTCRPDFKALRSDSYYSQYKREIESLVEKSEIKIAVSPDDENHIMGYIVYQLVDDIPIIHHAYTKSAFRKFGVFKTLIESVIQTAIGKEPIFITYKNDRVERIGEKYKFIFRPELRAL